MPTTAPTKSTRPVRQPAGSNGTHGMVTNAIVPVDQIPPQSLDMEQAVLGAMLIDRQAIKKALEILRPQDFYRDVHRIIFEAIQTITERGGDVDFLTVQEQLLHMDMLEPVGGGPYLSQLMDAVASAANVEHYAGKVEEKATLRRLIDAAAQVRAMAYSEYEDIGELVERAKNTFLEASETRAFVVERLDGEIGADELPAAKTVQEIWFGIYPGKATLLIGESGSGKSSLLYNFAIHAARSEPLWGLCFGLGRPLRILYVDPENAGDYRADRNGERDGGLCRRKIDRILGEGEVCPPTLRFADGLRMNLANPMHLRRLERRVRAGIGGQPFDIVLLDPLLKLCPVESENDNAQMQAVGDAMGDFAHRTGVALLANHHTGKNTTLRGVLSGRGGSGLVSGFDTVLTFRARGPEEDEQDDEYTGQTHERSDVCRLRLEKDRPAQFGTGVSLYLRMMGRDRFERVKFAEWKAAARTDDDRKSSQAEREIIDLLTAPPEEWTTKSEVIARLRNCEIGAKNAEAALNSLLASGKIERKRFGSAAWFYRLTKPGDTLSFGNPVNRAIAQSRNEVSGENGSSLPHLDAFTAGLPTAAEPAKEQGEI